MGFLLNQGGHLHSHGHGHSHGPAAASNSQSAGSGQQRQHGSLAVRAAFIHALGDLLQSVGVLIAAYIVRFKVRCFLKELKNCLTRMLTTDTDSFSVIHRIIKKTSSLFSDLIYLNSFVGVLDYFRILRHLRDVCIKHCC